MKSDGDCINLIAKRPQWRAIPVAKSISPQHRISTFDEVTLLLEQIRGPFVIGECICRKKKVALPRERGPDGSEYGP